MDVVQLIPITDNKVLFTADAHKITDYFRVPLLSNCAVCTAEGENHVFGM